MKKKNRILIVGVLFFYTSTFFCCSPEMNTKKTEGETKVTTEVSQEFLQNESESNSIMDYSPIPVPRLIGMADLSVLGTINSITKEHFTFQIEEFLKGEIPEKSIEVKKFIPLILDEPSPLSYAKGQRYILFLKKQSSDARNFWKILGLGGEGQMPVQDDHVYFEGSNIEGLVIQDYVVWEVRRELQRFDLPVFKEAVKDYGQCYSWNQQEIRKKMRWVASKNCADSTQKAYGQKSWFHQYLVRETLKKILASTKD